MTAGLHIDIDASEVDALARAWAQAPQICVEEMAAAALEGSLYLEREVKELTPVGVGGESGGLKGSIGAREPKVLADQVVGEVGTSIAHALPVELGTRPHFPPVQPLVDWAQAKLGLSPEAAERAGFAIARKIAARGTIAVGMFHRAFAAGQDQVQRIFAAGAARILARMSEAGKI